jgi:hypothetical protein
LKKTAEREFSPSLINFIRKHHSSIIANGIGTFQKNNIRLFCYRYYNWQYNVDSIDLVYCINNFNNFVITKKKKKIFKRNIEKLSNRISNVDAQIIVP